MQLAVTFENIVNVTETKISVYSTPKNHCGFFKPKKKKRLKINDCSFYLKLCYSSCHISVPHSKNTNIILESVLSIIKHFYFVSFDTSKSVRSISCSHPNDKSCLQ